MQSINLKEDNTKLDPSMLAKKLNSFITDLDGLTLQVIGYTTDTLKPYRIKYTNVHDVANQSIQYLMIALTSLQYLFDILEDKGIIENNKEEPLE